MSVCNGAFVLAKTGLLSGKSATAHHGGFFRFAATYPDVHLKRGARFVEEGNLASAGGISSGIDLALRVVERYVGRDIAADVADGMEYQGKGWLNPDSNDAYTKLPDFNDEHPICPVCLSDGDRSIKSSHKGKTYYFCATGEKEFFEAHLDVFERFLAEDGPR
jgi:YHS domain-containing protein